MPRQLVLVVKPDGRKPHRVTAYSFSPFIPMTANTVLQVMLDKYSRMQTYQDRGVVLIEWPDKNETDTIIFSTFFRRPNYFRFDWTLHHPYPALRHLKTHRVVWSDGNDSFLYTEGDETRSVKPQESLFMAVAGATGVSKGSALTVFNMLMPEMGAVSVTSMQNMELSETRFEGVLCYLIRGIDLQGHQEEIYASIDDYLLRSACTTTPRGIILREIRRDIQVDAVIAEDVFQFNPNM